MKEPAFPCERIEIEKGLSGLTKREYAAIHIAAALAGRNVAFNDEQFAQRTVALADAVLKEAAE